MAKPVKFYICRHCGAIVAKILDKGCPVKCCGEDMAELVPNTTDAATEKHVPVVTVDGDTVTVKVGSAAHPMESDHLIEWIYIQTERGGQRKALGAGDAPEAVFRLAGGDKVLAAYEYCNKHGLWKKEL